MGQSMKNTQQCMGEGDNKKHSTMYYGSMKNTQQCMGGGGNEKEILDSYYYHFIKPTYILSTIYNKTIRAMMNII
jgi:hypothetical protein